MTRTLVGLALVLALVAPLGAQKSNAVSVSKETMTISSTAVAFAHATLGAVTITSSSVANPTVVTTAAVHNLSTGQTVTIANHSGSTPTINGSRVVTVLSTTTFTIPVNVSGGGTGGTVLGPEASAQIKPNRCEGVTEGGAIRYWADGTNPTAAIGVPVSASQRMEVSGYRVLLNLRFIRQTADVTVYWQCYRE